MTGTGALDASVIVPTYRDWEKLQLCLDRLAAQSVPAHRFEVIVANNNPDPAVPGALRLGVNARVVHALEPGSYAARNAGIAASGAPVIFFTDSDCLPAPDWVAAGLARMEGLGPADRVGGAVELFPTGARWTAAERYDQVMWLRQEDYVGFGWAATANLVCGRAAFDLAGLFATDTFSGGDREWNLRAQAAGSRILYAPEMIVRHPARASFEELARKRRRTIGGRHSIKVSKSWRRFVPPTGYLVPSISSARRILGRKDLSLAEKTAVFLVDYRLRLVTFGETARLRFMGGGVSRG